MLFSLPICVIMVWVMNMDELKKRKTPRYQGFNYNCVGVYFLTICTQNRRCILSRIVGTGVENHLAPPLTDSRGRLSQTDSRGRLSLQILKEPIAHVLNSYRHSSVFATRSMAKTFGKLASTTILSATVTTMRNT